MPKIAFMFLIGKEIQYDEVWVRFFEYLGKSKYSVYVHAKDKNNTEISPFFKKHLIPSAYTAWGDLILGEYQLLKYAYKNKANKWFVFISDTTIPLKSPQEVYDTITSETKSRMCYSKNMKKATQEMWENSDIRDYVSRNDVRKHSQWLTLIRPHVSIILKNEDKVDLWGMRNEFVIADETYFGTVLQHNNQHNIVNVCDTYVDWDRSDNVNSPYTYKSIEYNHLIDLLAGDHLFARKFTRDCVIKKGSKTIYGLLDLLIDYI